VSTSTIYSRLLIFSLLLTLCVVVLGAYVRLSDAGLGCPDWPGCYGQLMVPDITTSEITASYERPLESAKAWKEMIHRYFAGTLGLLILTLVILAWKQALAMKLPLFLLGSLIFQALLGMWTVTLLLKPLVVMGHLLGGLTILSLVLWLFLRDHGSPFSNFRIQHSFLPHIVLTLVAVIMQIMLGGWTSSNYAALACTDFPTCGGHWVPPDMNFSEAFIPWRGLGIDYEGGILDSATRMAIHFSHRIGAVVVFCFAALLSIRLWKQHARVPALCLLGLLLLQWGLGISNVVFNLPVLVAAAHNGVAALLLLTLVSFLYFSWNTPSRETHHD